MTELTTGVLFLMSSLYGSGQANNQVANIVSANSVSNGTASSSIEQTFTTNDPKEMEKFLRNEYADDPILVDIARCESNFRQFDKDGIVIHGIANKADVGVMQINEKYHADTAEKLGLDLHTVVGNVAYAKHLYEEQGSQPWSASQKCWGVGNAVAKK
jgi:hypothetical protein